MRSDSERLFIPKVILVLQKRWHLVAFAVMMTYLAVVYHVPNGTPRPLPPYRHIHMDFSTTFPADLERDVLVFLHIQKTGGTAFNKELVTNLRIKPPCKCKFYRAYLDCHCYTAKRKLWLFSWFSTQWALGTHPDFTALTKTRIDEAMDKLETQHKKRNRNYLFFTILRLPVERYISEWLHTRRGATWWDVVYLCNGRNATKTELPLCYNGINWANVNLDKFLDCPHNLARNRQTRMLANLSLVNCYNHSAIPEKRYKQILLESAKENLKQMAFVGLTEFQNYTQILFENTFNLTFIRDLKQSNDTNFLKIFRWITIDQFRRIREQNDLDIQLYDFAKALFFQRLCDLGKTKGVLDLSKLRETFEARKKS